MRLPYFIRQRIAQWNYNHRRIGQIERAKVEGEQRGLEYGIKYMTERMTRH